MPIFSKSSYDVAKLLNIAVYFTRSMMNISENRGRIFIIKREIDGKEGRKLTYDSSLCFGCEMCSTVCPQNAITLYPLAYMFTRGTRIRIDPSKCILCGTCSEVCPSNALKVDGVKVKLRKFFLANFECEDCKVCEEVCPWDAIISVDGKKEWIEELCIFCGRCAKLCPDNKIFVEKPISGEVLIGEGCKFCGVCMDICPSKAISFDGKKVVVDEEICIFCGACKNACPIKVIEVKRSEVRIESSEYPWSKRHEEAINLLRR